MLYLLYINNYLTIHVNNIRFYVIVSKVLGLILIFLSVLRNQLNIRLTITIFREINI